MVTSFFQFMGALHINIKDIYNHLSQILFHLNTYSKTLILGIFIRLVLMPYTSHPGTWDGVKLIETLLVAGLNPLIRTRSHGTSFYIFELPTYLPYLFMNSFGFYYNFLVAFFFKIPCVLGDALIFYCIYKLCLLAGQNKQKALFIAQIFFLNPYAIYLSSVVGVLESLMISFILLSLISLREQRVIWSGIYLSIATFFRWIPLLLVPLFICHVYRKRKIIKYLLGYGVTSLILSIPYLTFLLPLFSTSRSAFIEWWMSIFSGNLALSQEQQISSVYLFRLSPAGLMIKLNVWEDLKFIFSYENFVIIYIILLIIFMLYTLKKDDKLSDIADYEWLDRFILAILILFSLFLTNKSERFVTMWILPFLILAAHSYKTIPRYYVNILWISNILTSPIIDGEFPLMRWSEVSPISNANFVNIRIAWQKFLGGSGDYYGVGWNTNLQISIGVIYWIFLILTLVCCLKPSKKIKNKDNKSVFSSNRSTTLYIMFTFLELIAIMELYVTYWSKWSLFTCYLLMLFITLAIVIKKYFKTQKSLSSYKLVIRITNILNLFTAVLAITFISIGVEFFIPLIVSVIVWINTTPLQRSLYANYLRKISFIFLLLYISNLSILNIFNNKIISLIFLIILIINHLITDSACEI